MGAFVTTLALHRHDHIFGSRQRGDQVVHLKHEAHGFGAKAIEVALPGHIVSIDDHLARCGFVQRSDHVEQRRLA